MYINPYDWIPAFMPLERLDGARCTGMSPETKLWAESAYLVARGVRSLAVLGSCSANKLEMLRMLTKLGSVAEKGAIPFVLPVGDGVAHLGFAAASWAIDLYRYAVHEAPPQQKHRIIGLLLGYSAEAIRDYEEQNWTPPTLSHEQASN